MRVTTAEQAAARDAAAITAGIGSFALMARAGTAAAAEIVRAAGSRLAHGVCVLTGGGNNGGDGWIVAAQLARLGVRVRVRVVMPARTDDARRAQRIARMTLPAEAIREAGTEAAGEPPGVAVDAWPGVVVDALLGTGATGALREPVARAAEWCRGARARGALVFSLDVPSGVDATTGAAAHGHVLADHTITFGTCKTGLLSARGACGRIVVVDIGLGAHAALDDGAPQLAEPDAIRHVLPPIAWNAYKGARGRVLIVGGAPGMAGAPQLAARGALASGAGLVRLAAHARSVPALQANVPAAVCVAWSAEDAVASPSETVRDWAHAIALGPGFGRDADAAAEMDTVLSLAAQGQAALVLDADALMLLARHGPSPAFQDCVRSRPVVLTPHLGEFAALARAFDVPFDGATADLPARLQAARALAARLACTVLLKGTPTVCAAPEGEAWCVPRGSAALGTGGTGDVLTGMLAALLASARAGGVPVALAAAAAWAHGVAGESLPARGATVDDIVHALSRAWDALSSRTVHPPDVLAVLPCIR